ncbi:MAG TPA: SCO family protein [Opitutus sp.]|nr:SCO family protein [Opitutus sp.]
MKNQLALSLLILAAPLCAADAAAKPDCCCAAPKPAVTVAAEPLSGHSIYQLDARWTDDAGRPFNLVSLRGHPVVVAMFYASCTYACPLLVADVRRIEAALPAAARGQTRIVLVSFDSQRDTPAALHAYRTRLGLDADWTLLHGSPDDVQELAMVLGVKFKQDADGSFSHSNLVTVLNPAGEITHQRTGLQGAVADTARAVTLAAR